MNDVHFLVSQEIRKAVSQYQSDLSMVQRATTLAQLRSFVDRTHGASWAMCSKHPEVTRVRHAILQAMAARIDALYAQTPTPEFARQCWEISRGREPRLALKYHRIWQDAVQSAKATESK